MATIFNTVTPQKIYPMVEPPMEFPLHKLAQELFTSSTPHTKTPAQIPWVPIVYPYPDGDLPHKNMTM